MCCVHHHHRLYHPVGDGWLVDSLLPQRPHSAPNRIRSHFWYMDMPMGIVDHIDRVKTKDIVLDALEAGSLR